MIFAKINLNSPDPRIIRLAAQTVLGGGIVLSPTDTIYGLACDARNDQALKRLYELKARAQDRGFLVLLSDVQAAVRIGAHLRPDFEKLASQLWPGPVTFLIAAGSGVSRLVAGRDGKVGCRVPNLRFLREWVRKAETPLVSTSANLSGLPQAASVTELRREFQDRVDLFIDGGEPGSVHPSTVVDLTEDPYRVVRQGLGLDKVLTVLAGLQQDG